MKMLRRYFSFLTLFYLSVFVFPVQCFALTLEKEIINLAKETGLNQNQVGFVVIPVGQKKPVIAINPDQTFLPASISKIVTSWAALHKWGSAYTFETKIKQYKKSLCIEGGGDPSLVQEKVFRMAEIVASEINDPVNMLYVDDSFLPTQRDYANQFVRDYQRSFTAPISALSMNYNSVTIKVEGTELGKKPKIQITPKLEQFQIQNKAITGKRTRNARVRIQEKNNQWVITIDGTFSKHHFKNYYRSITHPPLYFGYTFKKYFELLSKDNITDVKHSSCHPEAKTIYTYRSRPLGEMIIFMNKYSTNMIAEMLFAQLADPKGTVEASQYIQDLIEAELPSNKSIHLENGSGLSRRSSVTPLWFTQFVDTIYKDFLSQPEIFASLGISGIDGTLKRRTKHPKLIKNIRGKTGSLSGVTTLSGVMDTPYWGQCLFSLFFTHPNTPAWKIFDLEKRIFAILMSKSVIKENK